MALTIYGSHRSRTMRLLWIAEELGLEYRHEPLTWDDPYLKTPAFLAINPAGAIPAIEDDGFCLGESLAILIYLAKKYGAGRIYPTNLTGEAEVWRWCLWGQAHLEPWVQRDAAMAPVREAMGEALTVAVITPALVYLNSALEGRLWILGETFSVADLALASILSPSRSGHLDMTAYPNIVAWLRRGLDRPSAQAVRAKFPT